MIGMTDRIEGKEDQNTINLIEMIVSIETTVEIHLEGSNVDNNGVKIVVDKDNLDLKSSKDMEIKAMATNTTMIVEVSNPLNQNIEISDKISPESKK